MYLQGIERTIVVIIVISTAQVKCAIVILVIAFDFSFLLLFLLISCVYDINVPAYCLTMLSYGISNIIFLLFYSVCVAIASIV